MLKNQSHFLNNYNEQKFLIEEDTINLSIGGSFNIILQKDVWPKLDKILSGKGGVKKVFFYL